MLEAELLPELHPDLVPALPHLDRDDLARHFCPPTPAAAAKAGRVRVATRIGYAGPGERGRDPGRQRRRQARVLGLLGLDASAHQLRVRLVGVGAGGDEASGEKRRGKRKGEEEEILEERNGRNFRISRGLRAVQAKSFMQFRAHDYTSIN